jgi:hypothetical protein
MKHKSLTVRLRYFSWTDGRMVENAKKHGRRLCRDGIGGRVRPAAFLIAIRPDHLRILNKHTMTQTNGLLITTINSRTQHIKHTKQGTKTMKNPTAQSAIRTRYHGPTNTKGSRFSATYDGNRVTVSYDYGLNPTENHCIAAQAFLEKHNPFETKLETNALCFDNDFYWTWKMTGPRKAEAA